MFRYLLVWFFVRVCVCLSVCLSVDTCILDIVCRIVLKSEQDILWHNISSRFFFSILDKAMFDSHFVAKIGQFCPFFNFRLNRSEGLKFRPKEPNRPIF